MCYFRCCKNHFVTQTSLKVFFLIWAVVSPRSRSSDDLLDIDFSQTSFASSADSLTSGSQRNSFQLSQNGASNIGDAELTTQTSGDLRSSAPALPSSLSLGIHDIFIS